MKLIIHAGTGTILNASECVMLDTDIDITGDDREMLEDCGWEEHKVIELAEQFGSRFIGNMGWE